MSEFEIFVDRSQQNLIEIPTEILNLYNLRMLYLQGNRIEVLPEDFFTKLSKLTWLDLRDNQLITIPKSIRAHQHLENLLLSNNRLESLPNELGFVPKLKVLQISNNPIKYPDCTVIVQGTKAICEYLRKQYEKSETNNETDRESRIHQSETNELIMKDSCSNTDLSIDQTVIPIKNKQSNYKEIVHNISRNASKIRLKSSCSLTDDTNMKNLWMDKLRTMLMEQEKILQQEKNLQMLSNWKYNRKSKSAPKLGQQQPPYAIDVETAPKQSTTTNIDDLIYHLTEQLQHIENLQDNNNDRNNIEAVAQQIKAIMTIHKKLKHIKSNPL